MRRKILLLLLASVLVLPLCGCKKDISSESETIQNTQQDGIISTQLNIPEEWGRIDEIDFQFINELDDVVYYYQMENFYFDENKMTQPVIDTLNRLCEEKEKEYKEWGNSLMEQEWEHRLAVENGEVEADEEEFEGENSHNKWFFQYISYIGEDYVSLVYCEVTGMGGSKEYSTLEAYTIDCTTGNILTALEILGIQNDAALRCEISNYCFQCNFWNWTYRESYEWFRSRIT